MENARKSKVKKARKSGFRAKMRTKDGQASLSRLRRRSTGKGKLKNLNKVLKAKAKAD